MKQSNSPCPECHGIRVIAHVTEAVRWSADGMYNSGNSFRALLCSHCGHTTFYAQNVQQLAKEIQKNANQKP